MQVKKHEHENKLANETSPYLLQHAHNPVNWYPWGKEALSKAKLEDKPIFLSIGYSTCHWCHVMERESFEDQETADIMNKHFISIKVDREERPDIDASYMNFVVATTGSGGWPLNVFLTADAKPFFGGTYFPPTARYGMKAFKDILQLIAEKYKIGRETIQNSANQIIQALGLVATNQLEVETNELDPRPVLAFNEQFGAVYDAVHGGVRGKPKFPITLQVLFNFHQKMNIPESLHTLREMGRGGIFDQIGGGFHRYSVDDAWLVPHFEKMLYDNALLLEAYSKAYLITGDDFFRRIAGKIFTYAKVNMLAPSGDGFYSAQDADSEWVEGKFYVFTREEVEGVVEHPDLFMKFFGVTKSGNFDGKNILTYPVDPGASFSDEEIGMVMGDARLLREYRNNRVHPATDTKVVTFWNALMVSGLAHYYHAVKDDEARKIAIRVGESFLKMVGDDKVNRIAGKDDIHGFLDDHAGILSALIDLHSLTLDERYISGASAIANRILTEFYDGKGHLSQAGTRNEKLFAKDDRVHDAVVPSGASLFVYNLLRLNHIIHDDSFDAVTDTILKAHHAIMVERPMSTCVMVQALYSRVGDRFHAISIPRDLATPDLLGKLFSIPIFNKIVHIQEMDKEHILLCHENTCKVVIDVEHLKQTMDDAGF
ncbi:MAG: thioredoxin domain-containing protein [Promethearchaeota archaeon]